MNEVLANIELIFTVIIAASTVFYGAYKLWRKIRIKIIAKHEEEKKRREQEQEARQVINEIYKQLKPNGGSSLRDAIDSIDSRLYRVERQQLVHNQVQQLIMLDSGLAVFETDTDGECVKTNRTFQNLVGRSQDELLGNGWINCIEDNARRDVFKEWHEAVQQEREIHMTWTLVDNRYNRIEVNCKGFPLRDANGNVTGYMGFIRKSEEQNDAISKSVNRPSLHVL